MHYQVIVFRSQEICFAGLHEYSWSELVLSWDKKKRLFYFLGSVWKLISSFSRHRVHLCCVKQTSTETAKNTLKDLVCLHSPIKTHISLKRCSEKHFQQFYSQMYWVFFLCQASWIIGLPACLLCVDSAKLENCAQIEKFGVVPRL